MFPIVLAHGIARFDVLLEIQRGKFNLPDTKTSDKFQYFKGIKAHLEAHSFGEVFHPNENFAGTVDLRARQLQTQINEALDKTGAGKAQVIAHSMGGLDARRMIVDLEMADKVASLTTIGTPHLGTILADRVIGAGGFFWMAILKQIFNLDLDGFNDLTIEACGKFNRRAENAEATNQVFYQTYASFEERDDVFLPLVPSWTLINKHAGRNDGLVPLASQQWTGELVAEDGKRKTVAQEEFPFPADHLNEIGWRDFEETVNPFVGGDLLEQMRGYEDKVKAVYLEIAANLREKFD